MEPYEPVSNKGGKMENLCRRRCCISRLGISKMGELILVLVACLFISLPAASQERTHLTSDELITHRTLIRLKEAVIHDHIERLQVFYLPPTIETIIGLRPGNIDTAYKYKIEITSPSSQSERMISLCQAIDHTKINMPLNGFYDFRWGVKFYNAKTKEVYTIYGDRWGRNAVINNKLVSLRGGLYPWLKSRFFDRFEEQ